MPDLFESLQGHDEGHLRIIARLWGIELDEQADRPTDARIASLLLDRHRLTKMVSGLPGEAKKGLDDLTLHAGRLPWAQFTRTYGELREVGAAKRDRERPYEQPVSAAEILWYRALVAKSFFDTASGPEEFAYIPDDLLQLIAPPLGASTGGMGRQASASEYAYVSAVNDRILDHSCTLLAALRMGLSLPAAFQTELAEILTIEFLVPLLAADKLLEENRSPKSEPSRLHLETERGAALLDLFKACPWKEIGRMIQ